MSKSVQPMLSSRSFMFSGLTFRTLIEFIFVYVVRKFSNPIPLQFIQYHLLKSVFSPLYILVRLPLCLVGKESSCNAEDLGSIPGLGRYPGEGKGYPLQYSSLKNSMYCIVYGVTNSWTQFEQLSLSFLSKIKDHNCVGLFLGSLFH